MKKIISINGELNAGQTHEYLTEWIKTDNYKYVAVQGKSRKMFGIKIIQAFDKDLDENDENNDNYIHQIILKENIEYQMFYIPVELLYIKVIINKDPSKTVDVNCNVFLTNNKPDVIKNTFKHLHEVDVSNYKNAIITLQTRSKFSHNVVYELDIRKHLLGSNEIIDGDIITMRTDLLKTDITKSPIVDFFPWIPPYDENKPDGYHFFPYGNLGTDTSLTSIILTVHNGDESIRTEDRPEIIDDYDNALKLKGRYDDRGAPFLFWNSLINTYDSNANGIFLHFSIRNEIPEDRMELANFKLSDGVDDANDEFIIIDFTGSYLKFSVPGNSKEVLTDIINERFNSIGLRVNKSPLSFDIYMNGKLQKHIDVSDLVDDYDQQIIDSYYLFNATTNYALVKMEMLKGFYGSILNFRSYNNNINDAEIAELHEYFTDNDIKRVINVDLNGVKTLDLHDTETSKFKTTGKILTKLMN